MSFRGYRLGIVVSAIAFIGALGVAGVPTAGAVVPNCPIPPPHRTATQVTANAGSHLSDRTQGLSLPPLHASGQFLVDLTGHIFIPHGVNAVYKCYPYYPDATQLTATDINQIAALGFDSVRLGIIWEGLEPCKVGTRGCNGYNDRYLNRFQRVVQQFNAKGIYVLIDFHQDLYSDAENLTYCVVLCIFHADLHGEGAPAWAAFNDGDILGGSLYPTWGAEYIYPGVIQAFENLINPSSQHPDVAQHYRDAWVHVVQRFAGTPGVLGYDVLNEPWGGPVVGGLIDPYVAKQFDTNELGPFFQSIIDDIRDPLKGNDTTHTLFYEPDITNDFGPPYTMPDPPAFDPQDPAHNLALSYHVYCAVAGIGIGCNLEGAANTKKQEIRDRGIAGYMTEFGSSNDYDSTGYVADLAETNSQGWNYWQWKWWTDPTGGEQEWVADPNNVLDQDKAEQLARTYPRSIAADDPGTTGREPTWCFTRHINDPGNSEPSPCANQTEGHFNLSYDANRPGTVTTIYVPVAAPLDTQHKVYPNGYRITSLTGATVVSGANAPLLRVRSTTSGPVSLELDPR